MSSLLRFGKKLLIGYQAKSGEIIPEDYPGLCKVTTTDEPGRSYSIFELNTQGFPGRFMKVDKQISAKAATFTRKIENEPKYAHFKVKDDLILLKPGDVIEYLDIIPKYKYIQVSCERYKGIEILIPFDAGGALQWYEDPNEYTIKEVFTRYRPDLHAINVNFENGLELTFGQDLRYSKTLFLHISDDFRNKIILLPVKELYMDIPDSQIEGLDFTIAILIPLHIQDGARMLNVYLMDVTPDTNRRIREMIDDGQLNMIPNIPNPLLATIGEVSDFNTVRRFKGQGQGQGQSHYVTMRPFSTPDLMTDNENRRILRQESEPVLQPPPRVYPVRRTKSKPIEISHDLIDLDGESNQDNGQYVCATFDAEAQLFPTKAPSTRPNANINSLEFPTQMRQTNIGYQLGSEDTRLQSMDFPHLKNLLKKTLGSGPEEQSLPMPETGPHIAVRNLEQGLRNFTVNDVCQGSSSASVFQNAGQDAPKTIRIEMYADIPKDVSKLSTDELAQCFEVANLPGAAKYCRKVHLNGGDLVNMDEDEMNSFAKHSGEIKRLLEKIQKGLR